MSSAFMPVGCELAVVCEERGGELILAVSGELDLATAPVLEHHLEKAWTRDPTAIVLDLERLRFIDSTGLRLIVETHQRAIAQDTRFSLRRLQNQVQRVCDLVGVTGRVPIDD
jgi:anti-sigma B factor antagonist